MRITLTARSSPPLREVLPLRRGLAAELPRIAADLAAGVRTRTRAGKVVDGRPLRPKRDGTPSNLTDSGRMVASFGTESIRDAGFTLAPAPTERDKAAVHMRAGRRWIGASAEQIEDARERVIESMLPRDRNTT